MLCNIGPPEFTFVVDDPDDAAKVLFRLIVDVPVYDVTIVVGVIKLVIDVICAPEVDSAVVEDIVMLVLESVGSGSAIGSHHHGLGGPNPAQGGRPPPNDGLCPPNLFGGHRPPPKRPRPPPNAGNWARAVVAKVIMVKSSSFMVRVWLPNWLKISGVLIRLQVDQEIDNWLDAVDEKM